MSEIAGHGVWTWNQWNLWCRTRPSWRTIAIANRTVRGGVEFNPLTADDVYRRHGEWRRTTDDVYRRQVTYRRFSPSVAHSASSRFLQPFGNNFPHVWVQVQCKAATAYPKSERKCVEALVRSCGRLLDARRPGQSDRRGIGNQLPDDDSGDYSTFTYYGSLEIEKLIKIVYWAQIGSSQALEAEKCDFD